MSPVQCTSCGLIDKKDGVRCCYAFRRVIPDEELTQDWHCHYYQYRIVEEGTLLTPHQHFLIKCDEIERKR